MTVIVASETVVKDIDIFDRLLQDRRLNSFVDFDKKFSEFQLLTRSKFIRSRSDKLKTDDPKMQALVYLRIDFSCVCRRTTNCLASFNYKAGPGHVMFSDVNLIHNHERVVIDKGNHDVHIVKKNSFVVDDYKVVTNLTADFDAIFHKDMYSNFDEVMELVQVYCAVSCSFLLSLY